MKTLRKTATEDLKVTLQYDHHVSSSSWSVGSLTQSRADYSGKETEVIVDGGTLGTTYQITNTVTLEDYQVVEKSVLVRIVSK